MKRLLLLLIPSLSFAGVNVDPGTWDLYKGTARDSSYQTEAECIAAAKDKGVNAKYGCRTITTVIVTVDPVPEPPVVIPEPPKPEPPKPPSGPEAIKANAGPLTALKPLTGNQTLNKAGQVLEGFELRGGGITVTAPGVRIRNFRIIGDMKVTWAIHATDSRVKDLVIENGEIIGASSIGIYGHDMTVRRVSVSEMGKDGFRPTGNSTLEENYCEKIGRPGAHADCVQMLEGSNVTFRRNYFNIPHDDPNWMNSACFMIQGSNGPVTNITMVENFCIGGDYGARMTHGAKGIEFVGNTFAKTGKGGAEYGPFGKEIPTSFTKVCGNVYTDGTRIDKACQ